MQIDIQLLELQSLLTIKEKENSPAIFDPVRKKYLILQPEELVRQLLLQYLIKEKNYPLNRIKVESTLKVNSLAKRCDILVYSKAMTPFLLVECKSAKMKINQSTFEQIARYNMALNVPYLLVSNGMNTYCCAIDYINKDFTFLSSLPEWQ